MDRRKRTTLLVSKILLYSSIIAFSSDVARGQGVITTVAGGAGITNTAPSATNLCLPASFAGIFAGNFYVLSCDRIYKVTPQGQWTVVAGTGEYGFSGDGGPATSAQLGFIFSNSNAVVDGSGNIFFVDNQRIREVVAAAGKIQTVAGNGIVPCSSNDGDGGPATSAQLCNPTGVSVDGSGNIFIADSGKGRIREVAAATGKIQTVAGNGTFPPCGGGDGGPATSAPICPSGVFVDGSGNIFVTSADSVREVVAATGKIQTVAGNGIVPCSSSDGDGGPATSAQLCNPTGVSVDGSGNIFIVDIGSARIREVVAATGKIQTVAGNGTFGSSGDGGPATSAQLRDPYGVFVDALGNIFVSSPGADESIREVMAGTGIIQTFAGNGAFGFSGDGGAATSAQLFLPIRAFVDRSGNIFIADTVHSLIREVVALTGKIQTVAGNGTNGFSGDGGPATNSQLGSPQSVFADGSGNIFIADFLNRRIREVVAATGKIQTVAGNGTFPCGGGDGGPATSAPLCHPRDVSVDASGNIFIADDNIREVVAATGNIQTVAGNGSLCAFGGDGGPATSAQLCSATGVFVNGSGNIFIADSGNNRIREVVATTGKIQTVAGNGTFGFSGDGGPATSAALSSFGSVSVDDFGNLFIADRFNGRVREVVAATGIIQTIVGNGVEGFTGDGGPPASAELNLPTSVALDSSGSLLIADYANSRIRKATGDFAVSMQAGGSITATISAGQTATYNLQAVPSGFFNGTLTLTCAGATSAATCTAPSLTLGGTAAAPFSVTVKTTVRGVSGPRKTPRDGERMVWPFTLVLALVIFLSLAGVSARRFKPGLALTAAAAVLLAVALVGCSSGGTTSPPPATGTPAGTSTLTLTAVSGTTTHSISLTLIVN